ncbi:5151_t:CDS:10, partial [Paraglomus brasilianum]
MRDLPPKESSLFKQILRYYEYKQYKKGLKTAEQILTKFPKHGDLLVQPVLTTTLVTNAETLAMKGLFLNHMEKKEEAYKLVKEGLALDLSSHICWHVFGLLHRSDKNYGEALKCYTNALKSDKDNMQILQDYSLLQIQMRNYEAFSESRHHLLQLRPNNQRYWIGLAISYHLLANYEIAEKILSHYEKTLKKPKPMDFEHSEMLMYHNYVIEEMGNIERALGHLDSIKDNVVDKRAWKEKRAQFLLKLNRLDEAEQVYQELVRENPDCYEYFKGLQQAKQIDIENSDDDQQEKLFAIYRELGETFKKSNAAKRIPLQHASGERFKQAVGEYIKPALRKGVPSLFVHLKQLYSDPSKSSMIEASVEGYLQSLKDKGVFEEPAEKDTKEPPTAYLWALYFLAQHYDYRRNTAKAFKYINEAIEHTPTMVELYMTKGRILKHGGDMNEAMKAMNDARELDLQDRFINSKCVKYMLRNNQAEEAEKTIGYFTRRDAPDPYSDLVDMQCMWFALEEGECFARTNKLGKALKRFHQIEKHFADITDDQFDFHTYCLRKVTLRAYLSMLRFEDQLRSHPYYFCAAQNAIKIYLHLHDNPHTVTTKENNPDFANMTEGEIRKAKNKAKKLAAKAQREAEAKKAQVKEEQNKKKTDNPLKEALKFLQPLQELASERIETQLLGFEIYLRKRKYLLALKPLLKAHNIDKNNPELHKNIIRFHKTISTSEIHPTVKKVISAELQKILPEDKDLESFTMEFLESNKNSVPHLLSAAESLFLIDPGNKARAEEIVLRIEDPAYENGRSLK